MPESSLHCNCMTLAMQRHVQACRGYSKKGTLGDALAVLLMAVKSNIPWQSRCHGNLLLLQDGAVKGQA